MTAYLDYAGIGIVRETARAAMRAAIDDVLATGSAEYARFFDARKAARHSAARLLDCDADEIALVPNTSTGLHMVADGLEWRPGEEIVVFDGDFPANVHPWRRLTDRGVVLRWVPMRGGGYEMADVAAAVRPATRLIAVSHVNFGTGFRIDLDAVCALADQVGALVCVDAVQSLGVLPLSMARTPIDFLAAGAHKWLCGPPGTGLLYCRRSRLEALRWAPAGWFGYEGVEKVLRPDDGRLSYDLGLRSSARRFEGGMPNFLGFVGLAAALEEFEAVGVDVVADRIRGQTSAIRKAVRERGYRVLSPDGDVVWSGIVSIDHPHLSTADILASLIRGGCQVSSAAGSLRVSPHYWTSDSELETFFDLL